MPNIDRDMPILQDSLKTAKTQNSFLETLNVELKKENGFLQQEVSNLRKIALICTAKYDPTKE